MIHPATSPAVLVRPLVRSDLHFVLGQHRKHFADNVFGRLGGGFLRRYYCSFLDSPHAAALIATQHDVPVAYLVGIEDTGAHRRWLRRHRGPSLAMSAAWSLARRPRIAAQLTRARLARRIAARTDATRASADQPRPTSPVAVLSHIAVSTQHQGLGLGHRLVGIFIDACEAAGAARIVVATSEDNAAAARLYEANGWLLEARRTTFDHRSIRIYDKRLVADEHEGEAT